MTLEKRLLGSLDRWRARGEGEPPAAPSPGPGQGPIPAPTTSLARSPSQRLITQAPALGRRAPPVERPAPNPADGAARLAKITGKHTPYPAKNLNQKVRLNCKVTVLVDGDVGEDGDPPRREVVCRHLALAFAEPAVKKRKLMEAFSSERGIAAHFDNRWEHFDAEFDKLGSVTRPDSKHVLHEEQFGQYLEALANALRPPAIGEQSEADCLLVTARHVMAIHMSRKSRDGIEYFSVKVYDPNSTASYRCVEAPDSEGLRGVALRRMVIPPSRRLANYSDARSEPVVLTAMCLTPQVSPDMDRRDTVVSSATMESALRTGSLEDVRQMFATLSGWTDAEAAAVTVDGLLKILNAASEVQKAPGLFMALCSGHSETVTAFVEGVLALTRLSPSEKAQVIASTAACGRSGLYAAMGFNVGAADRAMKEKGVGAAIAAYIEAVLATKALGKNQKMTLIGARNQSTAKSAFLNGFQEGRTAAVVACARTVLASNKLDVAEKRGLLITRDGQGTSGRPAAQLRPAGTKIQVRNDPNTTNALTRVIQESGLSESDKRMFLNS